jgi:hypothetical protein
VVQEQMHSGLLVPADWIWPQADGVAEFSYGDRDYMSGDDRGLSHTARMGLWPTPGAVYLERVGDDAAGAIAARGWTAVAVPLSPVGAEQLRADLLAWIDPGPDTHRWPDGAVMRPSRDFTIYANCHDQVASSLRAAGLPLAGAWLPVRTRERFRAEVEAAVAEMERLGIRWVEQGP